MPETQTERETLMRRAERTIARPPSKTKLVKDPAVQLIGFGTFETKLRNGAFRNIIKVSPPAAAVIFDPWFRARLLIHALKQILSLSPGAISQGIADLFTVYHGLSHITLSTQYVDGWTIYEEDSVQRAMQQYGGKIVSQIADTILTNSSFGALWNYFIRRYANPHIMSQFAHAAALHVEATATASQSFTGQLPSFLSYDMETTANDVKGRVPQESVQEQQIDIYIERALDDYRPAAQMLHAYAPWMHEPTAPDGPTTWKAIGSAFPISVKNTNPTGLAHVDAALRQCTWGEAATIAMAARTVAETALLLARAIIPDKEQVPPDVNYQFEVGTINDTQAPALTDLEADRRAEAPLTATMTQTELLTLMPAIAYGPQISHGVIAGRAQAVLAKATSMAGEEAALRLTPHYAAGTVEILAAHASALTMLATMQGSILNNQELDDALLPAVAHMQAGYFYMAAAATPYLPALTQLRRYNVTLWEKISDWIRKAIAETKKPKPDAKPKPETRTRRKPPQELINQWKEKHKAQLSKIMLDLRAIRIYLGHDVKPGEELKIDKVTIPLLLTWISRDRKEISEDLGRAIRQGELDWWARVQLLKEAGFNTDVLERSPLEKELQRADYAKYRKF